MTVRERLEEFPIFDVAIFEHGFTRYLRDYELVTEAGWTGDLGGQYHYLFTHCVAFSYETRVRDDVWPNSWSDVFIDYQRWLEAGEPGGYVWGTNWALAYPGWEYIEDSEAAKGWSERLGKSMHEVLIETNAYAMRVVFHDVEITKVNNDTDLIQQVTIPLGD